MVIREQECRIAQGRWFLLLFSLVCHFAVTGLPLFFFCICKRLKTVDYFLLRRMLLAVHINLHNLSLCFVSSSAQFWMSPKIIKCGFLSYLKKNYYTLDIFPLVLPRVTRSLFGGSWGPSLCDCRGSWQRWLSDGGVEKEFRCLLLIPLHEGCWNCQLDLEEGRADSHKCRMLSNLCYLKPEVWLNDLLRTESIVLCFFLNN